MAIDKAVIEEARRQSLGGEVNTGSGLGGITPDMIAKARQQALNTDPAQTARLGKGTVGYGLRPDKYDFQMRAYADNNELRANQFGALKSFRAGLSNLVTNTVFELASGASNIIAGIPSAIASGDVNMIFDNAISTAVEDAQNWMNEEIFPIYNSVKDADKNILHRALTDLEFWTDDIMSDGVPFMASAWLTAYAGVGILRPLTKARYLSRLRAAEGLGAEATANLAKNLQATEQWSAAVLARTVEGMVEAKDTRDMVYEKLTAKGLSPEEASREAGKAAMATFGLNYILTPIEYIQAGSWFRAFGKSRDQLLNATKKGLELPKRYTLNKLGKEAGVNVITEGPIEENFQKAVHDYVTERFTGNDRGEIRPWEDEFRKGVEGLFSRMGDNFTTKEGWDAIGTGSILGGLFGGAAGFLSANSKAEKERLAGVRDDLAYFKDKKDQVNERVQSIVETLQGHESLEKLSRVQQLKGKENFWNIFETLKFAEYAYANFEAGLGQRIHDQIDEIENLSEEDFLSGYKDKNKVGELKQKAIRYEELFNMINERFNIGDDKTGRTIKRALFREAILQEELQKEIEKLEPKVNELRERLKPADQYEALTQEKSRITGFNNKLKKQLTELEKSEEQFQALNKTATKIRRTISENERIVKDLEQQRLAYVESQGEGFVRPKSKHSKALKDELKVAQSGLDELASALEFSLARYDDLARPETQVATASKLEASNKTKEEVKQILSKAKEEAATQAKAQEVSQETGKPIEKVLSNTAQLNDIITANHVRDGAIKGRVFEVNDDGTLRSVQSNSIIYPGSELSNIVVVEKYAGQQKTEDTEGLSGAPNADAVDAMLGGQEFDPFAGQEQSGTVDPQDTEPEETETANPDVDMSDEDYLFEDQKRRTNPYALGGLDFKYVIGETGTDLVDSYDEEGQLIRGDQADFYNYVNDPDNDLKGVTGKLILVDSSGSPDSMHIRFVLPNGLSTSLNTVDWVRNNVAKITDEQVGEYAKWRGQVVGLLQTGQEVPLTIEFQGPGALLRNQKIGGKRGRQVLADHLDTNTTPIGVTIKSKKGEQHVTRLYDWKGAPTPAVTELFGFGKSGRTYIGLPAANGELTPIPVYSRNIEEQEARIIINAVINRLEGKNYETIPGSTWTYNDLIRFYIYPSSSVKKHDVFISEHDKTFRVGRSMTSPRYGLADLRKYPQDLVAALMNKIHQVQTKRIINNEEVPMFTLVNNQLAVETTMRYRDYLFQNVLETDIQPIELEDKNLYFGQPVISFDPQSIFGKTPVIKEEKPQRTKEEEDAIKAAEKMFGLDEDDPYNLPATKRFDPTWYHENVTIYNEKELLEVMKLLPQVPIKVVKDLIHISQLGGLSAVGTFHKGLITLYENAPSGTLYHEAFHAVFRMMLTDSERAKILKGTTEEKLAEQFEIYMLSQGERSEFLKDNELFPETRNFFQRLWEAIKTFVLQVFGRVTPEDIFRRIKTGYYKHYPADPSKFKSIAPKAYNLTPKEDVALMNFITQRFFAGIFKVENFDLTDIESIGLRNNQIVDIYNNIKASMQKMVDESRPGDLKSKHQHIIDHFEDVVKAHQVWMAKYKIVPPELDYNPEEENLKLKDSFQFKEATEFSAKDNANYMVKLFISGLPKMVYEGDKAKIAISDLGLPEVTDYSETWNFLLEKLEGVTSIAEASERLKPYFKVKPEIQLVYGILNKPGTFTQEIFKTQLLHAFSKFNARPVTTFLNYSEDGKLQATTLGSEQQDYRTIAKNEWEANFMGSDLVIVDPLSRTDEYISNNSLVEDLAKQVQADIKRSKDSIEVIIESLAKFGITFSPNAVQSWIDITENGKQKFTTAAKYIITRFGDLNLKNKIDLFKKEGEISNLNLLADIEASFNPSIFEAVHLNPKKKPTYHYIQHNLLSTIIADVQKDRFGYVTKVLNSYTGANSKWAAAMRAGVKPVIRLLEGLRLEGSAGKLTTELTPGMWITMRIDNLLKDKPIFAVLRPAEKKSEWGLEGFELVKSGVVRNQNGKGLTAVDINSNSLIDQFFGYFEDEYKRTIYANLKEKKRKGDDIQLSLLQYLGLNSEDDINTDSIEPFDTRAKKMTFFGPIIKEVDPTLLHTLENFHRPEEDEIQRIRTAIKSYLVKNINRTIDYLNDESVIQITDKKGNHLASRTDAYKAVKLEGTDLSLKNITIGREQLEKYANDIFAAVADFAVNEMISAFELIKLTMGDVAYYKDFFKRTPLVTGTGKPVRIDSDIAKYITPEYAKIKAQYPLTKSKEEIINGDLNLAVVRSPQRQSSQLKDMRTQLKSLGLKDTETANLLKGYENYDEADAFSWITPQAAREFLVRIGDWNPSLESVYQNIVDKKPVSYRQLKHFMTAIKLMGAGPIDTGDTKLLPIAYLKTATMPIIPRAVEGKALGKLLERMYQSGTDMVIVDSGSKGASYNIQPLYDSTGQIDSTPFKNGKFNFRNVKLQIDVQQKSKNRVIFGTQLRKLVWSNIFQYNKDGQLVEKTFRIGNENVTTSNVWNRFNNLYDKLITKYRNNILKELGIDFDFETDTYRVINWSNLVEKIKKEAESRFYPKSVIDSIKLNPEGNGLDIPGDALVNRRSVENMLNAIIYNNVVAQKVRGTSSVQIPVTGFEDSEKPQYIPDSNVPIPPLKFISYENGRVVEAEIYLPHNFRYRGQYLNNLTIDQVDPEALQFIGFRIPTEGLRSIIKIKVKGFLPREMGDVVVVPSELVAQAGSDFDIDKLNIMQPHYFYNEESKRIERVKSGEDSIEGLENSIFDIVNGLLSHKDSFVGSLRTTGETVDYLKSVAAKIRQLKGEPVGREEDPLSIIEFDKKMEIAYKFIAGKDGVGVAALHNTHHILTQAANLVLVSEVSELLNLPHNKNKDNKAILSGTKDANEKRDITDILAASVNGFVDIVKDPFIIDLFTDLNTASVSLMLVRLGAPVEWVVKFINQPLIQRYIRNTNFARSEIGRIIEMSPSRIKNQLRAEYYDRLSNRSKDLVDTTNWQLKSPLFKNVAETKLEQYIAIGFSEGRVNDAIADITNNTQDITTDEYYLSQLSFLSDFLNYQELANRLRILMANSASDTYHAKTFNDVDRFVRRKEQIDIDRSKEELINTFENYEDLFEVDGKPTFVESFYRNGLKLEHSAFRKIFPIRQSERVQAAVRKVESLIGRTNQLRNFEIEPVADSLMGYIFYKSFKKDEIRDFVLDEYETPENTLLVSSAVRYNIMNHRTDKFIKVGPVYKKGDKLNLNGTHRVEIVGSAKMTGKQIMDKFPLEAPIIGARHFSGKQVYVYQVKVIQNKLSKKSIIRTIHEWKTSKESSPMIRELQNNVFFNNLRIYFSRKPSGINSLRFRARPTDNVVHEDLVSHWRKMAESGNPTIRDIAWKLAKYAIYQSGMRQTNISFFRYIPPEMFSQIVNQALIDFDRQDQHLDDPSVLNIIFKNLWRNNVYVPNIRNPFQLVEIFDDKGTVIGYRLRRSDPRNTTFFNNNAPPPFLKLTHAGMTRMMELVGFAGEKKGGDAIYQLTNRLGDGTILSEYHEGPSIYEENNEYIEDISPLMSQVNSSVSYWQTSAPLPPSIIEKPIAPKNGSFSDIESEVDDSASDDIEGETGSMGDDWVDRMFGGEEFDPFAQLSNQTTAPPDKELDSLLKRKLAEIGVSVQDVDKIYSKFSPIAVAKILDGTIKIAKGQADITTLPEEAAHIFVAMLDKSNPLLQKMMKEIVDYKLYKDVVRDYTDIYNGDETKLKLEAVGKLIGNIIVNDFASETQVNIDKAKGWWARLWEVLKRILNRITLGAIEQYTTSNPSIFEEFAKNIMSRTPNRTLAEAIIDNNFEHIAKQMVDNKYLTLICP